MPTQPRTENIRERLAKAMVGSAANDTVDTVFTKINDELAKLFEDRNFTLAGGGMIAVNSGGTSVTFSAALQLHVNSLVSGAAPSVIDLASTTRAFSADGRMLYAVINRTAATAIVTADSATLPAVTSVNQEVVLIAKRIGTTIHFRNGITVPASATRTMDGNTFTTNSLTVNQVYSEGTSNDTTSGSNVTLATPTTPIIRLTAAGTLVSIDMIPAGVPGQSYKYINATGASVNFNNLTGGTAADQIITGTNGTLSVANNASVIITYDSVSAKNRIIGGSGAGGSGAGGINYILSPSADTGTTGWVTYADAAGTAPVDGTGGSPNVTFTTTTSSPLRGSSSFLFTKDAVNRQGEGFSYDFTIDNSDKGKVLQGSLEYQIASGTFADNDISIWIYDVTNAVLIQPAPYLLKNSTLIEKFGFEFQTSINSTSYRIIFHVGSTSALAYTLKFDTFNVGPQAKLYGSNATDWVDYTPTFGGGFGTVSNIDVQKRIVNGTDREVRGTITISGAANGPFGSISLPSGDVINTAADGGIGIGNTTSAPGQKVGDIQGNANGGSLSAIVTATGTSATLVYVAALVDSATNLTPGTTLAASFANGVLSFNFKVPLAGKSSSQVMSSDADTRVVAASYAITTGVSTTLDTPLNFSTPLFDTHAAVTTGVGTWKFTAPVPGVYNIHGVFNMAASSSARLWKNGVANHYLATQANATFSTGFSSLVSLNAGDYIDIRITSTQTPTSGAAGTYSNIVNIERLSGPSQIAASETVNARYKTGAGQSIPNNTLTTVVWGTKAWDSHNAMNTSTGVFTAPVAGVYLVTGRTTWNANATGQRYGYVTTSDLGYFSSGEETPNNAVPISMVFTDSVRLLAGQTVSIQVQQTSGGALSLNTAPSENYINIVKVANY